ncbi:uncharacterized protein LOC126292211 [Schistocerca gregaria]|uniref:uncharacterized protein LOC126292211 n=1 Tax=Schistocerca gregaria TaxID=7010 RepID=UPI00211F1A71|nr:uncharacterized protein LOC126292211 [Schistocerca gregaria]
MRSATVAILLCLLVTSQVEAWEWTHVSTLVNTACSVVDSPWCHLACLISDGYLTYDDGVAVVKIVEKLQEEGTLDFKDISDALLRAVLAIERGRRSVEMVHKLRTRMGQTADKEQERSEEIYYMLNKKMNFAASGRN